MGQINYLTGLDSALYYKHEDTRHRFVFLQQVNWAGEYLVHKVQDGKAGSSDAKCETYNFSDQIYKAYLWVKAPAIKAVVDRRNNQAFPCDNNLRRLKTERKAAIRIGQDAEDDFGEDEEEDDFGEEDDGDARSRRSRRSRRSAGSSKRRMEDELIERGVSRLMEEEYGCTGIRRREEAESRDASDARSTAGSVATRSPGRQGIYAYYVPAWVYVVPTTISLQLGTVVADLLINRLIYILHDVSVCESKKLGLREMTKRLPANLSADEKREMMIEFSSRDQEGWLPIPMWHTTITNKALHVCAMDWSPPEYHMSVAPWTSLIRRSSRTVKVLKKDGSELQDNDLWLAMVFYHLYVDGAEREIIIDEEFDLLYTRHDFRKESTNFNRINIKWSGPTTMLYWVVERESCVKDNDHFNWWGFFGQEPVLEASISFGQTLRQNPLSGFFFRVIQAFEKCEATPECCAYMYGFCFEAFNHKEVTGSVNLLRYTEATLDLTLQRYLTEFDRITVWIMRSNLALLNHSKGSILPVR